jgi:hypothetical protein
MSKVGCSSGGLNTTKKRLASIGNSQNKRGESRDMQLNYCTQPQIPW